MGTIGLEGNYMKKNITFICFLYLSMMIGFGAARLASIIFPQGDWKFFIFGGLLSIIGGFILTSNWKPFFPRGE